MEEPSGRYDHHFTVSKKRCAIHAICQATRIFYRKETMPEYKNIRIAGARETKLFGSIVMCARNALFRFGDQIIRVMRHVPKNTLKKNGPV